MCVKGRKCIEAPQLLMKFRFLIIFVGLLLIFSCKSRQLPISQPQGFELPQPGDTIVSGFRHLSLLMDLDSVNPLSIVPDRYEQNGYKFYESKVFQSPDWPYKVLNVYGEATKSGTKEPLAMSYIFFTDRITDLPIRGEVFRIDALSQGALIYADNISQKGSDFSFYEISFRNDSLVATPATPRGNYYFELIRNKKEKPSMFPQAVDRRKRFTEREIEGLQLDTMQLGENDYFFLTDDQFLDRQVKDLQFKIYFTHLYGDEFTKWLRIEKDGNYHDVLLAQTGGDSDSYFTESEFTNDSTFVRTNVYSQLSLDTEQEMGYEVDSVIHRYQYDREFTFKEIAKDSFRVQKHFKLQNGKYVESHRTMNGNSFIVNGQLAFWHYDFFFENPDEPQLRDFARQVRTLRSMADGKKMLVNEKAMVRKDRLGQPEAGEVRLDINFDGFDDYSIYNAESSGSAGEFLDVYLYDPKKKVFNHSDELSGYDLQINAEARKVTSIARAGYANISIVMLFFDDKGKVKYTKVFRSEFTSADKAMKLTYKKIRGKKVLDQKTEILPAEEVENEVIIDYLLGLEGE